MRCFLRRILCALTMHKQDFLGRVAGNRSVFKCRYCEFVHVDEENIRTFSELKARHPAFSGVALNADYPARRASD